jgi:TonB family protein
VVTLVGLSPRPLPMLFVDLVQGFLGAAGHGDAPAGAAGGGGRAAPASPATAARPTSVASGSPGVREPGRRPAVPVPAPDAVRRPVAPEPQRVAPELSPQALEPSRVAPEPSRLAPEPPPVPPEPAPAALEPAPAAPARPPLESPVLAAPPLAGESGPPSAFPGGRADATPGGHAGGGAWPAPPGGAGPGAGGLDGGGAAASGGRGSAGDGPGSGLGVREGSLLALAIPGDGSGAGSEYDGYVALLRRRVQEMLAYPAAARRRELTGTVQVEVDVQATGAIAQVALAASSSHHLLDEAAVEAARGVGRVPFPPGVRPRPLRVRLPVVFDLRARP